MTDLDWKAIDRETRKAEAALPSIDAIAKIIDPHSFLPDNSGDQLIEEMVRQGIELARSKARRILSLMPPEAKEAHRD